MPNYVECPVCDRLFEDRILRTNLSLKSALQLHIELDHHKVRVRKGSNYKWVDAKEVERRLEETEKLLAKGRR